MYPNSYKTNIFGVVTIRANIHTCFVPVTKVYKTSPSIFNFTLKLITCSMLPLSMVNEQRPQNGVRLYSCLFLAGTDLLRTLSETIPSRIALSDISAREKMVNDLKNRGKVEISARTGCGGGVGAFSDVW
jgi:hypothetical protein